MDSRTEKITIMFIYFFQDIADPFFAYCKMHAEKVMSRAKRRNWLAIQSHIRKHQEKKIEDEKEKVGIPVSRGFLNIYVQMLNFLVSITKDNIFLCHQKGSDHYFNAR